MRVHSHSIPTRILTFLLAVGLLRSGSAWALRVPQSSSVRGQLQAGLEDQNAAGLESGKKVREIILREDQVLARYDDLLVPMHLTSVTGGGNSVWVVHQPVGSQYAYIKWVHLGAGARGAAAFQWASVFSFSTPSGKPAFKDPSFPVALPPRADRQEVYVLEKDGSVYRTALEVTRGRDGVAVQWSGQLGELEIQGLHGREARGAVYDPKADRLLFLLIAWDENPSAYSMAPLPPDSVQGVAQRESAIIAYSGGQPVSMAVDESRGWIWVLEDTGDLTAYAWRKDSYHRVETFNLFTPLLREGKLTLLLNPWHKGRLAVDPVSGAILATRPKTRGLWVIDPGPLRDGKFTPTFSVVHLSEVIQNEDQPIPAGVLPERRNILLGSPRAQEILVLPKVNELLGGDALDWSGAIQQILNQPGSGVKPLPAVWGIRLEGDRFLRFDRSLHPDSGGGWKVVDLESGDPARLELEGHFSLQGRREQSTFQSERDPPVQRDDFKRAVVDLSQGRLEVRLTGESAFPLELRYGTSPPQDIRGEDLKFPMSQDDLAWLALAPLSPEAAALLVLTANPPDGRARLLEAEVRVESGIPKFHYRQVRELVGRSWMGLAAAPDSSTVYTWNWGSNELVDVRRIPTALEESAGSPQAGLEEPEKRIRRMLRELAGDRPTTWQVVGPSVIRKFPALAHLVELMDRFAVEDETPEGRAVLLQLLRGQKPPVDYAGYHTFIASEYEEFRAVAQEVGVEVENARRVSGLPGPEQILQQILAGWVGRPLSEVPRQMAEVLADELALLEKL